MHGVIPYPPRPRSRAGGRTAILLLGFMLVPLVLVFATSAVKARGIPTLAMIEQTADDLGLVEAH